MADKIALFDIDGVLADYEGQIRKDLALLGEEELPDDLFSHDIPKWLDNRIKMIQSQDGWWENLPVIQSGLELIKLCVDIGFNIHILTQGPRLAKNAWTEKFAWCDKYVAPMAFDYGISVTRNGKGLHYGRLFVDDYPPYMDSWLQHRSRGLGLMPRWRINEAYSHPQVFKYDFELNNWKTQELIDRIKYAYDRISGLD